MNLTDPALADPTVIKVVASVVIVILAALFIWTRIFRSRTTVASANGERILLQDAIQSAQSARLEAHTANNNAMAVQRQLGRLEAENKACTRRSRVQAVRIGRLERQNIEQAGQIRDLARALKGRFNPSASDL